MALKNSVATTGHTVADEMAGMRTLAGFGLSVHPERCVRLRNRHASCSRCADACTSGAIELVEGAWQMHPEKCVGCGTCATVCPTCALETQHPNDAALLHKAKRAAKASGGEAVFCCHKAAEELERAGQRPDPEKTVEVICLSRLEETLIFSLLAAGVERICAVHGVCEDCPRKLGRTSVALVADTVERIANGWGIAADYRIVDVCPEGAMCACEEVPEAADGAWSADGAFFAAVDPANHNLLATGERIAVADAGHIEATYMPAHVQKDGTLPHFVPERRRRLLDALATFGEPQAETLDTRLWGHVVIDFSLCQSCKMCAVFCPTGAISKYRDECGVAGIEHYAAECVRCCLCRDICPGHAIMCETAVPAAQLAGGVTERYPMADPVWHTGPDQILQRMRVKISGNSVEHSY